MKTDRTILSALLLLAMAVPARADFSYQVAVGKHEVSVAAWGNGEFHLKVDGKTAETEEDKMYGAVRVARAQDATFTLVYEGKELIVETKNELPLLIDVVPKSEAVKPNNAQSIKVGGRTVWITDGGQDKAGKLWAFESHIVTKYRTYMITQMGHSKQPSQMLKDVLKSFRVTS